MWVPNKPLQELDKCPLAPLRDVGVGTRCGPCKGETKEAPGPQTSSGCWGRQELNSTRLSWKGPDDPDLSGKTREVPAVLLHTWEEGVCQREQGARSQDEGRWPFPHAPSPCWTHSGGLQGRAAVRVGSRESPAEGAGSPGSGCAAGWHRGHAGPCADLAEKSHHQRTQSLHREIQDRL